MMSAGQNGVMVNTTKVVVLSSSSTIRFSDKHTFNLQAQSHDFAVNGILCEQGESYYINPNLL